MAFFDADALNAQEAESDIGFNYFCLPIFSLIRLLREALSMGATFTTFKISFWLTNLKLSITYDNTKNIINKQKKQRIKKILKFL